MAGRLFQDVGMTTTICRIPAKLAQWSVPPASRRVGGSAVPAAALSAARTMAAPDASCSAAWPAYCSGRGSPMAGSVESPGCATYRKRSTAASAGGHPSGGGHVEGACATSGTLMFAPDPFTSASVIAGHIHAAGATGGLKRSCGGGGGSGRHAVFAAPHATASGSDQEMRTSMTVPLCVTRRVGNGLVTLTTNGAPMTRRAAADKLPGPPSAPWAYMVGE